MDALKFAFEILIVGALALPWLAILIRMFVDEPVAEDRKAPDPRHPWRRPPTDDGPFHLSVVPESVRSAAAAAFVVAIGYLLGSSVSRISRETSSITTCYYVDFPPKIGFATKSIGMNIVRKMCSTPRSCRSRATSGYRSRCAAA